MDLSVVIVSWNVRQLLYECLTSIYHNTVGIQFEVFVVDNDSQDGTQHMVRTQFPQAKLIANDFNAGFPKANNQAIRHAGGRYILALNPDTRIDSNALAEMVRCMDTHPEAGAMGPKLLNSNGTLQRSCRGFPDLGTALAEHIPIQVLMPNHRLVHRYRLSDWDHLSFRHVDQPMGACLLVRAEVIRDVGLMDEDFFIYFDEVDWCYRIKKAGWHIFFDPTIEVTHHGGQSFSQWSQAKNAEQFYTAMIKFFRKHYGRSGALLLRGLVCFAFSVRTVRLYVAYAVLRRDWETKRTKLVKYRAILSAAVRG